MSMFNTTANITSITELGAYNSDITDGGFGIFILAVMWLIVFSASFAGTKNSKNSMTAAFFTCFIAASVLVIMGWIGTTELYISIAGVIVAVILNKIL